MRVFTAVLHMDEPDGTPHLHIDFIPVATEQKRGLEVKNSMRQALEQQGFDFQTTKTPPEGISATYGKRPPRIGGGRWLDAERAQLGRILEERGIGWDKQNTHREHLSVSEYKACAEIIRNEVQNMSATPLQCREPTTPMKIAGVKADEIIVLRSSVDALAQENMTLQAQAELAQKTIQRMDTEKRSLDEYLQRNIKKAHQKESHAQRVMNTARQEVAEARARYSHGTAEKYQELAENYNNLSTRYKALEQEKHLVEINVPVQLKAAVAEAIAPLQAENAKLREEIGLWKKAAALLKQRVFTLAQTLHDVMRSIFTLKYNFEDKSPNPFRSTLTDHARYLIDALERKSRAALLSADFPDLEKKLDGMGVSA